MINLNKRSLHQEHTCGNHIKAILFVCVMAFILSLGFRIHSSSKLAARNQELKHLSDRKIELEKQLALMEYEDSKYSSLQNVEAAAYTQGFIKSTSPLLTLDINAGTPMAALSRE